MITQIHKLKTIQIIRFLEDNYWDCPVLDYSRAAVDDYPKVKDQCG